MVQVSAVESDAQLLLADSALADVRSLPLAELRDLARERNVAPAPATRSSPVSCHGRREQYGGAGDLIPRRYPCRETDSKCSVNK